MKPKITKQQFIEQYARNSRVSVERLLELRTPARCNCGEDGCKGWQMVMKVSKETQAALPILPATLAEFLTEPTTVKIRILAQPNRVEFSYPIQDENGKSNLVFQLNEDRMTIGSEVVVNATPAIIANLIKYGIEFEEVK